MDIYSTYSTKIKHYNHILNATVRIYRDTVDYLIAVCLEHWDYISMFTGNDRLTYVEFLTHKTENNPFPVYDFDSRFYKLPSVLRRSAVHDALGKVSSYKSNLANWKAKDPKTRGKEPSVPKAGFSSPALYKKDLYKWDGTSYTAMIKVFINNTWDWLTVELRKSDVDYINRHCKDRERCSPTLQKRGKEWFLDFSFLKKKDLNNTDIFDQTIVAVDLGINTAATISVMRSDGTILGRHFCKPTKDTDSLMHSLNRIKKAQQHGNYKTPRLWAKTKGINHEISVKTANYIVDVAEYYKADVIVFEHLDIKGKKHGSKKQKLHMWRKQEVQAMVTDKAHRLGIRISRICAWGTSQIAYDGSGKVLRGNKAGFTTYELCKFRSGKVYNCDLSASYNIGARYFLREIPKSLHKSVRLALEANVPQVAKRSTSTFSTLISLNAVLASMTTDKTASATKSA